MITLHFPSPDQSPIGRTPVRLRWRQIAPGQIILSYARDADLTPSVWLEMRASSAWITAGDEKERRTAADALNILREEITIGS